jgi:elongation factor P
MPKAAELKRSDIVEVNGQAHVVEELQVQSPSARGSASLYKFRFRNLITKQKVDRVCKGEEAFRNIGFERKPVQYVYRDQDKFAFMDVVDFSQFELSQDTIAAELPFLTDGLEGINALSVNDQILAIELPPTVELEIVECEPALRGASVTGRTKPATLSTGHVVQVPEYMERGEVVRVDTRSGKYLSRA